MRNDELEARRVRAQADEIARLREALRAKNTSQASALERQLAQDEDDLRATLRELALDAAVKVPTFSSAHKDAEIDVGLVRAKLADSLDGHIALAAKRVKASRGERMSDDSYAQFIRSVKKAADLVEADQTLAAIEKRERRFAEIAVKERPTYGVGSPHSYFADIAVELLAGERRR